jgi:hypothetical protein
MLETRGFIRKTYDQRQIPDDFRAKTESKCGHLAYWVRIGTENTATYTTYAHACLAGAGITVTFSDYPRFSSASATKQLAVELSAAVSDQFPNAQVVRE